MSYNITMNELPQAVSMLLEKVDALLSIKGQPGGSVNDDYLNIEEAAKFLDKEVNTIYGYTSARKIPFYKNEGKLLFKRSDLIKHIEEKKVPVKEDETSNRLTSKK